MGHKAALGSNDDKQSRRSSEELLTFSWTEPSKKGFQNGMSLFRGVRTGIDQHKLEEREYYVNPSVFIGFYTPFSVPCTLAMSFLCDEEKVHY